MRDSKDNGEKKDKILTETNVIRGLVALVVLLSGLSWDNLKDDISDIDTKIDKVTKNVDAQVDKVGIKIDSTVGEVGHKVDSLKDVMHNANLIHNNIMNRLDNHEEDIQEIKDGLR